MTKREFVELVAAKSGLSKRDAGKALDAVLDAITDVLKEGGQVNFAGFGKFSTQHRAARMGVNPRNPGEKVHLPETTVPKFTAGSALKSTVRGYSRGADSEGEPDEPWEPSSR